MRRMCRICARVLGCVGCVGWCSDGARISFLPPFRQFWMDLAEIFFGWPTLLRNFDGIDCFELAAFFNKD